MKGRRTTRGPVRPGEVRAMLFPLVRAAGGQRAVALSMGMSPGRLSSILSGKSALTAHQALRLSERFLVPAILLLYAQARDDLRRYEERRK